MANANEAFWKQMQEERRKNSSSDRVIRFCAWL